MAITDKHLANTEQALEILYKEACFYYPKQYGLLAVTGVDANSFLQSQLTNDINELKTGEGHFSCLLDRKAHVLAYFHLFKSEQANKQIFYILIDRQHLRKLMQLLEQFVFAAQVEFKDCSELGSFISIEGPRANRLFASLAPELYLHPLGRLDCYDTEYNDICLKIFKHSMSEQNGYLIWVEKNKFDLFVQEFEAICHDLNFRPIDNELLDVGRIEAGVKKFGVDFDENNLLPEAGLVDSTVSYKKGCFVGQEILARIRSHGVPAKAIIGLVLQNSREQALQINSPIISEGKEIGILKSNCFSPSLNKHIALAILQRDYRMPQKNFNAVINDEEVTATVIMPPFVSINSNKDLAQRLFKKAVKSFVNETDVHNTEAINLLREILILDPCFEDAYEALAVILSKENKLNEAINLMKSLAELNPDSVMAHSNLSQFYVQQGLKELAEEEKALALSIRMRLAAAQFVEKQNEESEKEKAERQRRMDMFRQVLALDNSDFFANAGYGECLVEEKKFADAIPYLQKTIEQKNIHLPAYLNLFQAYRNTGQIDRAKQILSEGIFIATKRGDSSMLQKLDDQFKQLNNID